jgi:hypothetical protein
LQRTRALAPKVDLTLRSAYEVGDLLGLPVLIGVGGQGEHSALEIDPAAMVTLLGLGTADAR